MNSHHFLSTATRRREAGITLLEMVVVLAIFGVLLGSALPVMSRWIDGSAIDLQVSSLRSAMRLAREEALRRGETVSVCARAAGDQSVECASGGSDWSHGWLVFVDRSERGVRESDDTLVAVYQSTASGVRVQSTLRHVSFQHTGISINAASNYKFFGRQDSADDPTRVACVSKTGRLRVSTGNTCA